MASYTWSPQTVTNEIFNVSPSLSLKDKQLKATIFIKELLAHMDDMSSELNILYDLFASSDGMTRGQTLILRSLRQTIISFVKGSAANLK